jgi:anti-anti-sigma factor
VGVAVAMPTRDNHPRWRSNTGPHVTATHTGDEMPLHITHDQRGQHDVLVVDGELDLVTAPQLTSAAFDVVGAGARDVIVDAHALTFCDSSGLTAFVRIANRLEARSGRLAIAGPPPIVRRVLEVSGLDEAFVVVDEVPDAVSALGA